MCLPWLMTPNPVDTEELQKLFLKGDFYWRLQAQLLSELTAYTVLWRKELSPAGPVFICFSVWWVFFSDLLHFFPERE